MHLALRLIITGLGALIGYGVAAAAYPVESCSGYSSTFFEAFGNMMCEIGNLDAMGIQGTVACQAHNKNELLGTCSRTGLCMRFGHW